MFEGTVFIVDDEPLVAESIAILVRSMGIECQTFSAAEEFLSRASDLPGCLITDVRMLGMSGLQLLEIVRERRLPVKAIVLTAYADVRLTVDVLKAGAVTLLEKPYRDQELWDSIVEALQQAKVERDKAIFRRQMWDRIAKLSREEIKVFRAMVEDLPNKVISKTLDIAPRTVDLRRQSILRKLESPSAIHALRSLSDAEIALEEIFAERKISHDTDRSG